MKVQPRLVHLIEDQEEDPEEARLREAKDREAKQLRKAEAHARSQAAAEAEESAQLAQLAQVDSRGQTAFTQESNGHVIAVRPVRTENLPCVHPAPMYAFNKEAVAGEAGCTGSRRPQKPHNNLGSSAAFARRARGIPRREPESEFSDGFTSFGPQQPALMETMVLAPGVQLTENGASKSGGAAPIGKIGLAMTWPRKDDDAFERGKSLATSKGPSTEGDLGCGKICGVQHRRHTESGLEGHASSANDHHGSRPVTAVDADLLPARSKAASADGSFAEMRRSMMAPDPCAPVVMQPKSLQPTASTRPVQTAPLQSLRRVQKRGALGYGPGPRDRIPIAGTISARYGLRCDAQPPLGSTMGHGLLPQEQNWKTPQRLAADSAAKGASAHGKIVCENPDLVKRLFACI